MIESIGMKVKITGSGSYIPDHNIPNSAFLNKHFYNEDGTPVGNENEVVIEKLQAITGIKSRKYADEALRTSDIAAIACEKAIEDAQVDRETIDQIIVGHNFGDIIKGSLQPDMVPSIGSRVKYILGIKNTACIPYDVIFGCPGWIQGLIQANSYIQSGMAKKCLVVGAETLSRIVDPHDRDSMIFADGAGAVVIEATDDDSSSGILSYAVTSHGQEDTYYLYMGATYKGKEQEKEPQYIKMHGRKIYEYALTHVPNAIKSCLDKANITDITKVKKIFIHQANAKMDEAIIKRLYKKYGVRDIDVDQVMPMNIGTFGNSSVATVPTLFDLVKKGKVPGHQLQAGDIVIFASVGAGMNINAITYKM